MSIQSLPAETDHLNGVKTHVIMISMCVTTLLYLVISQQRAKKVLSDSPGLVDFAIRLVNSVFNLPDGLVMFYEEFR